MNTLIVPCAGKSSRFPGMKPKWMLTHPDGRLMIEKSLSGLNLDVFDRIIITIVKPHDEKYEASLILKQVFAADKRVEICILPDFTKSASETIYMTLTAMDVKGSFVIKDSDNCVKTQLPKRMKNAVVGYDLHVHKDITNIPGKSFLIVNEQNMICNIVEKRIVSNIICLGVYCFADAEDFKRAYLSLMQKEERMGEMFISHIISYMLSDNKFAFEAIIADGYNDWGTLTEWKQTQKQYRTYFIDVDGVILKNSGKYGSVNWSNNKTFLDGNVNAIKKLQEQNAQIVITTSRTEEYKEELAKMLESVGIKPYAILTGMNHAARVVINDFAPTNPYPSAISITLPRNSDLSEYL